MSLLLGLIFKENQMSLLMLKVFFREFSEGVHCCLLLAEITLVKSGIEFNQ